MATVMYDYSALRVNGVNPTRVIVNGTQIYRLVANGIDIIHKYVYTAVTFTLTPSCYLYTQRFSSCNDSWDEASVRTVSLRVSWSAYKPVSKVVLTNVSVNVYGYSGGRTVVSCGESYVVPLGSSFMLWKSVTQNATVTASGSMVTFSYSSAPKGDFICNVLRMDVLLSGTVYFSDGTSAIIDSVTQQVTVNTNGRSGTYSGNLSRSINAKEY